MTKYLTTVNFTSSTNKNNLFIVLHYTANNGDTALNNAKYFYDTYRGASAHYFVDENEIVQVVEDKNVAWHCGATSYVHPSCRNSNSIGIEMCSRINSSGNYYILDDVVYRTYDLVKSLMEAYSIPIENVIRHYDVTGKICPAPMVNDQSLWTNFINLLSTENQPEPEPEPVPEPEPEIIIPEPITSVLVAKSTIKSIIGLADETVDFLNYYRYGTDLLLKIANAVSDESAQSVTSVYSAKSLISSKIGLADETITYLYNYRYGDDLLKKIASKLA